MFSFIKNLIAVPPLQDFQFLLAEQTFSGVLDRERNRADRNGGTFSLVVVKLPEAGNLDDHLFSLDGYLKSRLRGTDVAGILDDYHVGVLLPDTSFKSAWRLAGDIRDNCDTNECWFSCEVVEYPEQPPQPPAAKRSEEPASMPDEAEPTRSMTSFFVRPLRPWKRAVDIVGAATGLVVAAPILLLAAAAIKLTSRGPVFFVNAARDWAADRFGFSNCAPCASTRMN